MTLEEVFADLLIHTATLVSVTEGKGVHVASGETMFTLDRGQREQGNLGGAEQVVEGR